MGHLRERAVRLQVWSRGHVVAHAKARDVNRHHRRYVHVVHNLKQNVTVLERCNSGVAW